MTTGGTSEDLSDWLSRARDGDPAARQELLVRHRDRLRRMIDLRLDPRLLPRIDASDVVQEALADAWGKLSEFFDQPLPFYPWLRQVTWNRLLDLHRRHVGAQKRSVRREETPALTDGSVLELAERLAAADATPSQQALDRELHERVRQALLKLSGRDRDILVLRHLEEMSVAEVAAVLGITENNAKVRHLRALRRLRQLLTDSSTRETP